VGISIVIDVLKNGLPKNQIHVRHVEKKL